MTSVNDPRITTSPMFMTDLLQAAVKAATQAIQDRLSERDAADRVQIAIADYLNIRWQGTHHPAVKKELFPAAVIGITGYTGSGKSTLAEVLAKVIGALNGKSVRILPLAKALKEDTLHAVQHMVEYWGLDIGSEHDDLNDLLDGDWKRDIGRLLYQGLGELRRKLDGNRAWVNLIELEMSRRHTDTYIVPDVRYPESEATWIRMHPRGVLIATESGDRRGDSVLIPEHASEKGIARCKAMADLELPVYTLKQDLPDWCKNIAVPEIRKVLDNKASGRYKYGTDRVTHPADSL